MTQTKLLVEQYSTIYDMWQKAKDAQVLPWYHSFVCCFSSQQSTVDWQHIFELLYDTQQSFQFKLLRFSSDQPLPQIEPEINTYQRHKIVYDYLLLLEELIDVSIKANKPETQALCLYQYGQVYFALLKLTNGEFSQLVQREIIQHIQDAGVLFHSLQLYNQYLQTFQTLIYIFYKLNQHENAHYQIRLLFEILHKLPYTISLYQYLYDILYLCFQHTDMLRMIDICSYKLAYAQKHKLYHEHDKCLLELVLLFQKCTMSRRSQKLYNEYRFEIHQPVYQKVIQDCLHNQLTTWVNQVQLHPLFFTLVSQ